MSGTNEAIAQEQGVGTPEGEATQVQSQAQPAVEPVEQQTEQTEQEPQYVTRADAERMVQEALNQARSYADKGRAKLQAKMQEVEATIQNAEQYGRPFTDEEKNILRQNAQVAALKDEPADDTAQLTPAQAEEAQYVARELGAYDQTLQEEYGFNVGASDPEVKNLRITGDPVKDMKSVKAMFQAKKDRLASAPQSNTTEANDGKAAVRAAPGATGQKPTFIANSVNEYWEKIAEERRR